MLASSIGVQIGLDKAVSVPGCAVSGCALSGWMFSGSAVSGCLGSGWAVSGCRSGGDCGRDSAGGVGTLRHHVSQRSQREDESVTYGVPLLLCKWCLSLLGPSTRSNDVATIMAATELQKEATIMSISIMLIEVLGV